MTVDEVDFCVTTFKRPGAVAELFRSIADRYPAAAIHVADQNEGIDHELYDGLWGELSERGLLLRPTIHDLDFDCGISAARNHLVATTPRKYKLILDDDFVFTEETTIEKLIELLEEHPEAGVVGGVVTREGAPAPFDFRIEKRGGVLRELPDDGAYRRGPSGIRFRETDCVVNFALMRQDVFGHVLWDPELKVVEHEDFYLRLLDAPYSVLHTPDVIVDHPPPTEDDADYAEFRVRPEFVVRAMLKHDLTRVETINGLVVELCDGALTWATRDGELEGGIAT